MGDEWLAFVFFIVLLIIIKLGINSYKKMEQTNSLSSNDTVSEPIPVINDPSKLEDLMEPLGIVKSGFSDVYSVSGYTFDTLKEAVNYARTGELVAPTDNSVDWNRLSQDESNEELSKEEQLLPTDTANNVRQNIQAKLDQHLLVMLNNLNVQELHKRYSGVLDKKRYRCNTRSEYIEVLCRNVLFFNIAMDKYYDKFQCLINSSDQSELASKEFEDYLDSIQGNKSLIDQDKVQQETASYNRIENSISLLEAKYISGYFRIMITGNALRFLLSKSSILEDLRKTNIFEVIEHLKKSATISFENTLGKMIASTKEGQSVRDNYTDNV